MISLYFCQMQATALAVEKELGLTEELEDWLAGQLPDLTFDCLDQPGDLENNVLYYFQSPDETTTAKAMAAILRKQLPASSKIHIEIRLTTAYEWPNTAPRYQILAAKGCCPVIREADKHDLPQLLALYLALHETTLPPADQQLQRVWQQIYEDPQHHVIVAEAQQQLLASCICVIIPNLTRGLQPYALIENVVTAQKYRDQGLASACLAYAKQTAQAAGCYKIMLLTGSKEQAILDFYQKNGFNSQDKTAFIQWL